MEVERKSLQQFAYRLERDSWGQLSLIDSEMIRHDSIELVPLFPISEPRGLISILSREGVELAMLNGWEDAPEQMKTLLDEELFNRDFVPIISRIVHVSGLMVPCEWTVETDRGRTQFVLKAEEDIRRLSVHEVLIVDANGGKYRIRDTRSIDNASRRHVEWYV